MLKMLSIHDLPARKTDCSSISKNLPNSIGSSTLDKGFHSISNCAQVEESQWLSGVAVEDTEV
jgi:hypothetical protein